ncbi:oligosaccharide flippase family protein [Burkholderia sp. L27(2015)]|uniref:oligosaccharide flippase family protein n=1 Tax=Burkholderia sp. L27(2015) TaxID=1641858 RepID=UPI00131D152C|nr:oligosaccharide flippase family protein [Burkholderia sp. L27(2015)]
MTQTLPASRSISARLLSGGLWVLASRALAIAAGFAVSVLLTRMLTPHEVGSYFLIYSLVAASSAIAMLGLNFSIVRLIAESLSINQPGRAKGAIFMTFALVAGALILIAAVLIIAPGTWLTTHVFGLAGPHLIWLSAAWIAVFTLQLIVAEMFRGLHDIRFASIFGGLVISVLGALFFLMCLLFGIHLTLASAVTLSVTAGVINFVCAGWLIGRKIKLLTGKPQFHAREMLAISAPLWIVNLTLLLLTQADVWILSTGRGQDTVAIYGAAVRMTQFMTVPLLVINSTLLPVISEMYARRDSIALERVLRASAALAVLPAAIALGVFLMFGTQLIGLAFGNFYRGGLPVLLILSLGQFVNIAGGSCGYTLMMTGHQRDMMWITVLAGALTVGLGFAMVQTWGAVGVALGSAIGLALQTLVMWLCTRWRIGIWTHPSLRDLRLLLSSLWRG